MSFIYKNCDLIIGSSRPFVPEIRKLAGNTAVCYLPNSADADFETKSFVFSQYKSEISGVDQILDQDFSCVFTGNLGKSQSLETILSAAQHLSDHPDIKIVIFGYGNQFDWLSSEVTRLELKNLHLMGRYPAETMPYVMSKASCLLCSLADSDVFKWTLPNKIQSYLAAGKPIIACLGGEGAQIVREAKAGVVCPPGDGEALAHAILKLKSSSVAQLNRYGLNGKKYFNNNYQDNLVMVELLRKFSELVEQS